MNPKRPDLPCPWCRGRFKHVLGCPSPDDLDDPRWERQKLAHSAAVQYGGSEHGLRLLHLNEPKNVVQDALLLLKGSTL